MMQALWGYRLVKKKWASRAFDGEGAKRFGGRWNSPGRACVYAASSESLALLEIMVHLEDYRLLEHYALFRVRIDASNIATLDDSAQPPNWRDEPAPMETALIGDLWLEQLKSPVLKVPSVIVTREYNYLLNPAHPDFETIIQSVEALSLSVDTRLYKHTETKPALPSQ